VWRGTRVRISEPPFSNWVFKSFPKLHFYLWAGLKYSFQPNVVLYVFPRAIQCHFQGEIELA
jgi:hypothetical protein